jgi:hypothetical protein
MKNALSVGLTGRHWIVATRYAVVPCGPRIGNPGLFSFAEGELTEIANYWTIRRRTSLDEHFPSYNIVSAGVILCDLAQHPCRRPLGHMNDRFTDCCFRPAGDRPPS